MVFNCTECTAASQRPSEFFVFLPLKTTLYILDIYGKESFQVLEPQHVQIKQQLVPQVVNVDL